MKFSFHPDAEAELNHAIEFYEASLVGLGLDFAEEVYATIGRIIQYPKACSVLSTNSRRALVYRFPFAVIYHVTPKEIYIIAIAHLNRKPFYWNERG